MSARTRLGRQVEKFRAAWMDRDADARVADEAELARASEIFKAIAEKQSELVADEFIELIGLAAIECGFGGLKKARTALEEGWPELWAQLGPTLDAFMKDRT